MKTVVDQNCLGRPELRAYLEASKENEAVVTDMAIFEMLKGSDPTWGAKRRLEIASDFPDQVFCTAGTGELMRREITSHTPVTTTIDDELTDRFRRLLRQVADYRAGRIRDFPLEHGHIVKERVTTMRQRLKHASNKQTFDKGVKVLREKLPVELQRQIRSGNLTKDVYAFAYQTGFIAFRDSLAEYGLPSEVLESLYLGYSMIARQTMLYMVFSLRWFEVGGSESLKQEAVTNEFHDIDYVLHATYYDDLLSIDGRVEKLYGRTEQFFGMKIVDGPVAK